MIEIPILISALLAGFLGSGHCVLMCGAISESLNRACGSRCGGSLLKNLSRIAGYSAMGALVGGFGNSALTATRALEFRSYAQFASGIVMIVIGATLLINRQAFAPLERPGLKLLPLLIKLRAKLPKRAGWTRDIGAGLIWSLMPCGMVYAALSAAWLSVSAVQGGLIMLCFGLGTLPAMLGLNAVLARLNQAPHWRRGAAISVLLLGLISLGYASGFGREAPGTLFGSGGCVPAIAAMP
jgi:sulfite exporter TauE/SafE